MGADADLILAATYKVLAPAEPPFEDSSGINGLYYIHDKKMALLIQAVYALIKVQDLVNRLLHESLGGDLVNTSQPDWQEDKLKSVHIIKGLESERAAGAISAADFANVTDALKVPRDTPKGAVAKEYKGI